jgi:hypothetical protein
MFYVLYPFVPYLLTLPHNFFMTVAASVVPKWLNFTTFSGARAAVVMQWFALHSGDVVFSVSASRPAVFLTYSRIYSFAQ